MIKAIIIEDEKPLADYLREVILEVDPTIEIAGQYYDVSPGIKAIEEHHPQLVFLDIMLPEGSGFDVLDALPHRSPEVIFVTAHDSFWQQAFDYAAIGYLLKPVYKPALETALSNARKRIEAGTADQLASVLEKIFPGRQELPGKLAIPTDKGYRFESFEHIIRLESSNAYTWIYLTSGVKLLSSYNLGEFRKILPEKEFIQVHKSHIVSTKHMVQFNTRDCLLETADGALIPVSRRSRAHFMRLFPSPKR